MSKLLRPAALWLWIAIGGEMPEPVEPPMPEPALGDMGGVKVLLLPAPCGAYSAALEEPGEAAPLGELAPELAPAAA